VEAQDQLGANIRRLRRDAGLSQMELSDRCGLHFSEISRLERGGRDARLSTIVKLAQGLGVPPAELLAGVS
jgi:transcriptional regulator with XRE-family HTH domain